MDEVEDPENDRQDLKEIDKELKVVKFEELEDDQQDSKEIDIKLKVVKFLTF